MEKILRENVRHPEKVNKPDTPILRKPNWIRVKAPNSEGYKATKKILKIITWSLYVKKPIVLMLVSAGRRDMQL